MVCPSCGVTVGEMIAYCARCENDRLQTSSPNERKQLTAEEYQRLYTQSLGTEQFDGLFRAFSHPLVIALGLLIGWILLLAGVVYVEPNLTPANAVLTSLVVYSFLLFEFGYLLVLFELFFVDKIAAILCALGVFGLPFLLFVYYEEIGKRKMQFVFAAYFITICLYFLRLYCFGDSTDIATSIFFF